MIVIVINIVTLCIWLILGNGLLWYICILYDIKNGFVLSRIFEDKKSKNERNTSILKCVHIENNIFAFSWLLYHISLIF